MSDREVRAGEIYRYFRDTNMILLDKGGKIGGNKLRQMAEERASQDIERLLSRSGQ